MLRSRDGHIRMDGSLLRIPKMARRSVLVYTRVICMRYAALRWYNGSHRTGSYIVNVLSS